MIIDGKKIANEIKVALRSQLSTKNGQLLLAVILVGDNLASHKYVERKKKVGEEIGVEVVVHEYPTDVLETDLVEEIEKLNNDDKVNGIIVQLPLSPQLNQEKILNLISPDKDVDALGSEARVLSPTVGAIKEILEKNKVSFVGKKVVVVGNGKLVGRPVSLWLTQEGAEVEVVDINTKNSEMILRDADIIVSGVGKPGLITPDKIRAPRVPAETSVKAGSLGEVGRQGVVLIDAGTAEAGGELRGDADPACADKCSLFTPVPGGVGPLTVVMLFKNLLELSK